MERALARAQRGSTGSAKPPDGHNVEGVSSDARRLFEKQCPPSSAEHSTDFPPSEEIGCACSVGARNHRTGGGASQKTATIQGHRREDTGADFLVAGSSNSYTLPNFQQEMTEALPGNHPTIPASQQQGKQQSVLQVAPMAVRVPRYGEHFRYEVSKFKTFWSCDLHYRDWRQVFAASPFPNAVPPNRLLAVRTFICTLILVAEGVATVHSYQYSGWPIILYFTTTYCILETVFWILITGASFRALVNWKEPLHAKPTSPTEPLRESDESITTGSWTQHVNSASTTGQAADTHCCDTFNENGVASTCFGKSPFVRRVTVQAGVKTKGEPNEQPLLRCFRVGMKKVLTSIKKFWRIQGYKDLLADRRFCVKGIIFAPNPTCCPTERENIAAGCSCHSSCKREEATYYAPTDVYGAQRAFVCAMWVLHSLQLTGSTFVFIAFFASMRANGTSFTEFWYTAWRHLVLIIIAVLHSVFLSRIPFPVCHVGFAYIIWVLYIIVQVLVFVVGAPNGEGDIGCVYRVFTLSRPLEFSGYGVGSLALIAVITVSWWSLLRQRSVDVDPPPSVSIPATKVLDREESTIDGDEGHQLEGEDQSCFGAQLLWRWGKRQTA